MAQQNPTSIMESQKPKTLPLWQNAIDIAVHHDLLKYGHLIPTKWMEENFCAKAGTLPFIGESIQFRKAAKELGYILSERGTNGTGMRVLTREEMADHVRNEEFRAAHRSALNATCLGAVPRTDLDELDSAKLDHWEKKAGILAAVQFSLLRSKTLPSPEMAIKSLKQIK